VIARVVSGPGVPIISMMREVSRSYRYSWVSPACTLLREVISLRIASARERSSSLSLFSSAASSASAALRSPGTRERFASTRTRAGSPSRLPRTLAHRRTKASVFAAGLCASRAHAAKTWSGLSVPLSRRSCVDCGKAADVARATSRSLRVPEPARSNASAMPPIHAESVAFSSRSRCHPSHSVARSTGTHEQDAVKSAHAVRTVVSCSPRVASRGPTLDTKYRRRSGSAEVRPPPMQSATARERSRAVNAALTGGGVTG
jgi:hypothetical protein